MTSSARQDEDESLAEIIGRLDEPTAKMLLERAAAESGTMAAAVRLAVAVPADRVAILRGEADSVLRTRRHLDYREANAWAFDAGAVVDEIEAEAAANPSRELLKLIELSVGRVVKVILKSDDSSGLMGDVAHRLLAIHVQVSLAGVAEPKALARWMIKFGFDDQDFFTIDPVLYAPALADKGMAAYRKAVAERLAQARVPFAVENAIERLAVLDGDVEAIVALLGQDLSSPHQYTRVAEAMLELGRDDDALRWAERGIEATSGWAGQTALRHRRRRTRVEGGFGRCSRRATGSSSGHAQHIDLHAPARCGWRCWVMGSACFGSSRSAWPSRSWLTD